MISVWQDDLGYAPGGTFLVLSGGDMWTGPAISTWFQGQSMVEVMNAMDYDAAAVGNHEFDFGLEALRKRVSEMEKSAPQHLTGLIGPLARLRELN